MRSWRRFNKAKTACIPVMAAAVFALHLQNSLWVLMLLSWVTWFDASLGAWRADED